VVDGSWNIGDVQLMRVPLLDFPTVGWSRAGQTALAPNKADVVGFPSAWTADGGATWEVADPSGPFVGLGLPGDWIVNDEDGSFVGFYDRVGYDASIGRSVDHGKSQQTIVPSAYAAMVAPFDLQQFGNVYQTLRTDKGKIWIAGGTFQPYDPDLFYSPGPYQVRAVVRDDQGVVSAVNDAAIDNDPPRYLAGVADDYFDIAPGETVPLALSQLYIPPRGFAETVAPVSTYTPLATAFRNYPHGLWQVYVRTAVAAPHPSIDVSITIRFRDSTDDVVVWEVTCVGNTLRGPGDPPMNGGNDIDNMNAIDVIGFMTWKEDHVYVVELTNNNGYPVTVAATSWNVTIQFQELLPVLYGVSSDLVHKTGRMGIYRTALVFGGTNAYREDVGPQPDAGGSLSLTRPGVDYEYVERAFWLVNTDVGTIESKDQQAIFGREPIAWLGAITPTRWVAVTYRPGQPLLVSVWLSLDGGGSWARKLGPGGAGLTNADTNSLGDEVRVVVNYEEDTEDVAIVGIVPGWIWISRNAGISWQSMFVPVDAGHDGPIVDVAFLSAMRDADDAWVAMI